MNPIPRRLWQVAGVLAVAHVVLIPISIALQRGPLFADGTDGIQEYYVDGDLTRSFTGGILESFGFLLMVPVLVFLGRALGRRSEVAAWAAQTGVLCGLGYVVVTFAVGFPAGGAAMYGAQHGLDLDAAFAINNLRIFGYFLSLLLLGGMCLGFAVAALAERVHPRWFGWFGLVAGVACLASTPLAGIGAQDYGSLVFLVWFIGVGVLMLRHRAEEDETVRTSSTATERTIVHS